MAQKNHNNSSEGVENLKQVIATFERITEELTQRRRGASDSVMVVLDERLAVNRRTLDALHRSLKLAEDEARRRREGV